MAPTGIEATAILCDFAQVAEGKLYVMGGAWTRIAANSPAPMTLAVIVHVPWDQANQPIKMEVALRDEEGGYVLVEGNRIGGEGEFEVGRPPGMKQGEQLSFPMVFTLGSVSLDPGGYVWQCEVSNEIIARCPFRAERGAPQ